MASNTPFNTTLGLSHIFYKTLSTVLPDLDRSTLNSRDENLRFVIN